MTRIVVGPFNRVEGDLELKLDVEDDRVVAARVTTPLYRGFEQILIGRPIGDALVIAPRICGICSVSQSLAAAKTLAAFSGAVPAPNGALTTALAHAAENLADHLSHFYLFFMPDFARAEYAGRAWAATVGARFTAVKGSAAADFLPARSRLLEIMGLIAGKWPHSLAFRPGGTTLALDLGAKMRLRAVLADVRAFLETTLFDRRLEDIAAIETPDELDRLAAAGRGDFTVFLKLAADLDLARLGRGPGMVMSYGAYADVGSSGPFFAAGLFDTATATTRPFAPANIVEDPAHSWFAGDAGSPSRAETLPDIDRPDAYSWARAPRYDGRAVEVGAVARQLVAGHPLVRAMVVRDGGTTVASRVVARLLEVALVVPAMETWVGGIVPAEPFCAVEGEPTDGSGIGLVEAARGGLGHWMTVRGGRITRYQIVAPTTWNFSPRDGDGHSGPLEGALEGTTLSGFGARAAAVQHVVRSFDPCMVCTAH
ncbi:nickel-dependent hydrogenase large subunit [Pinisolibacter sp.]|uniref:nickel-dependent hydrogenase large subunit n=1 Tax=Pinisolibacter sp. TaxID=2172024 RepID=UPI002FDE2B2E